MLAARSAGVDFVPSAECSASIARYRPAGMSGFLSSPVGAGSGTRLTLVLATLGALGCTSPFLMPAAAIATCELNVPFGQVPGQLEVRLHRGLVLVQGGRELSCKVEITVRAESEAQARQQAASVRILLEENDRLLSRLRVSHATGATLDAVSLRYRLTVPGHVGLRVISQEADAMLRNYRGRAEVTTESGRVHARLDGGSCKLMTTTGDIRVEGTYAGADLQTRHGFIEAVLPRHGTPAALLSVRSGDGGVQLDVAESLNLDLRLVTKGGRLTVPSELRVEWRENGATQADRSQLFHASIGESTSTPTRALVETASGGVEVRRLAEGSGG